MSKIDYVTMKVRDLKVLKILIGILIAINIILCFKGMALMQRNAELINEKQVLEEIMEIQKEKLEEI